MQNRAKTRIASPINQKLTEEGVRIKTSIKNIVKIDENKREGFFIYI